MYFSTRSAVVYLTSLMLALPMWAQRGALTVPVNLTQISDRAAVIVHGNIIRARVEPHPDFRHLTTVLVTVRVRDSWKGHLASSYTFRQFVWDIRDRQNLAGYRKGDEVVLFMNPVNQYGLTSPVALEQGRFRVTREPDGTSRVTNGRGNAGLLRQTAPRLRAGSLSSANLDIAARHRSGPLKLETLREFVRSAERSRKTTGVQR
jgi:hypothetical protein